MERNARPMKAIDKECTPFLPSFLHCKQTSQLSATSRSRQSLHSVLRGIQKPSPGSACMDLHTSLPLRKSQSKLTGLANQTASVLKTWDRTMSCKPPQDAGKGLSPHSWRARLLAGKGYHKNNSSLLYTQTCVYANTRAT